MAEVFANTFEEIGLISTVGISEKSPTLKLKDNSKIKETTLKGTGPIEFRIVVEREIMIVTNKISETELTVLRGQENTIESAHSKETKVYHKLTAGAITKILTLAASALTKAEIEALAEVAATHAKTVPRVVKTGGVFQFETTDEGKIVEYEHASTIGKGELLAGKYSVGAEIYLCQVGKEKVEVVPGANVEIKVPEGLHPRTDAKWSTLVLRRRGGTLPEQWVLAGDLEI